MKQGTEQSIGILEECLDVLMGPTFGKVELILEGKYSSITEAGNTAWPTWN